MKLRDEHLYELFSEGKISEEDAIDHSQNPGDMQDKVEAFKTGKPYIPTQSKEEKGEDNSPSQLRK